MEDLDLARLAEYLHVTPEKVKHMAERGRIPGRKVGGQWKFNQAEIHHWLEDRIGASDMDELDQVQKVVDRVASDIDERPLTELCTVDTVCIPLNSRTRGSVIRSMCDLAANSGLMWDAPMMAEAVKNREQMHPTALDCGVALLHPRRPQTSILAESVLALAVCPASIPFSDRGQLTDVFFLICSYDDASHLRILAKLSRVVGDAEFLSQIRQAKSSAEGWHVLKDAEDRVDEYVSS